MFELVEPKWRLGTLELPKKKTARAVKIRSNGRRKKAGVLKCEACEWAPPDLRFVADFHPSRLFHVHHIIPISCRGDDTAANRITLCPTCHALAHAVGRRTKATPHRWDWYGPETREDLLTALRPTVVFASGATSVRGELEASNAK